MSLKYSFQLQALYLYFRYVDHTLLGQVMETVNVTDELNVTENAFKTTPANRLMSIREKAIQSRKHAR